MRLHASDTAFSARAIGADLHMSAEYTRSHLETLTARGFLQVAVGSEVAYRYAPRSPELQAFVATLVEWWSHSRSVILEFVALQGRSQMRSFSRAFDIRKEK